MKKTVKKNVRFQNGGQKRNFAWRKKSRDKKLINHFPEAIFQ